MKSDLAKFYNENESGVHPLLLRSCDRLRKLSPLAIRAIAGASVAHPTEPTTGLCSDWHLGR
jgi:hypothetical protein